MVGGKKQKRNCYVYEHSEIIFGPATLKSCNTFLDEYITDTRPDLRPGTVERREHEEKYYTVGTKQ